MKKTSIALCAVLFGALVVSNVFAEETLVANNEAAANETGAVVEATTGEAEKSINDTLHAILDKYFEDNAKKFKSAELKKNFFETVKANIKKAAENARASQKKAFDILVDALETYELK